MANTIQRDEHGVNSVVKELVDLIAAEDDGQAETMIDAGSFEAEIYWLSRNMTVSRGNLLRAAALIIEDIVLGDISNVFDDNGLIKNREDMMNWAAAHIEALQHGASVKFRPTGQSMKGKVESGQLCEVAPFDGELQKGDIVLAKVKGNVYLHLIHDIDHDNFQIGNNRGYINGWVKRDQIFGKLISVKD